jgi:D-alanyl-D-alanine endopeptidase (penicillin-binding protein 7)
MRQPKKTTRFVVRDACAGLYQKHGRWGVRAVALLITTLLAVGAAHAAPPAGEGAQKVAAQSRDSFVEAVASLDQRALKLRSASALVLDQNTGSVVYSKNTNERVPIASITKLMTAMVVLDAHLPLNERIKIADADIDRLRWTRSRLKVGSVFTREELLRMALMSSENRAAAALGRSYPGGIEAFVAAMNAKARSLGMRHTTFVDSSGLHTANMSTADDVATMVRAAHKYALIRSTTTTWSSAVQPAGRSQALVFRNTNLLVRKDEWDIGVSKTGYLRAAGYCLVMQAAIVSRPLIIVLLDSKGKLSRIGDANRIRRWLESGLGANRA